MILGVGQMKNNEFILVCGNCGERLTLEDNLSDKKIDEKFSIVSSDDGRIYITCKSCENKISF